MQQRLVQQASKDYSMRRTITYAMFVCAALFSTCAALAVEVAALPEAEFADTEVSTNVAFAVGAHANRKLVFMKVEMFMWEAPVLRSVFLI